MTKEQVLAVHDAAQCLYRDSIAVVKVSTPYVITLLSGESMRFAYCIPDIYLTDIIVYAPRSRKTCTQLFEALAESAQLIASIEIV